MNQEDQGGERLQKILARAGFGSRRVCDDFIAAGRVAVNGETALLGRRIDVQVDIVTVDGVQIGILPNLVYYLLNKPTGIITTAHDPEGRPSILTLVPEEPRVFPVGRLDMDSEGLIVITNDGNLSQLLSHPSHGIEKEYLVELGSDPTPGGIRALREGVEIEPGVTTAPAKVARVSEGVLRITIHEGRYRQVRRMCDTIGCEVLRLVRTRLGPITASGLAPGQWRELTTDEVRKLEREATTGVSQAPQTHN